MMQPAVSPATRAFREPELRIVPGSRFRARVSVAVAALVLLGLGILATRQGPGVTPDSVQYLSTAHHVARGEGVRTSITELTVDESEIAFGPWPPLYPSLLGTLMRSGVSPFTAPRWINLVCLPAMVLLVAWLAGLAGGPRAVVPAAVIQSLLYYPVMLSGFVWSEPLYIVFSLAALGCIGRGLERDHGFPWEIALAGFLAAAAMLTRYIGFTLIGSVAAGLVLVGMHLPLRTLIARLLAFLVPAAGLNAAWLFRNRAETGFFFGEARPEAWFGWDRILRDTLSTLVQDWGSPVTRLEGGEGVWLTLPAAVGALILLGLVVRRLRTLRFGSPRAGGGLGFVLWIYAGVFGLAMILLSRAVGFDPINTRYLAPVYPVGLILAVLAFHHLLRMDRRAPWTPGHRRLLRLALAGLLIPQLAATTIFLRNVGAETRTITYPYWTSTQWDDAGWAEDPGLTRVVELAGPDGLVISNLWDLVGIRTGIRTKPLPEPDWSGFPDRLWAFPGAIVAVYAPLRTYRATAGTLRRIGEETGHLEFLETVGEWTFFRIRLVEALEP